MFDIKFPLTTPRLVIRPLTLDDFGDLYDMQSRADVTRYLPYGVRDEAEVRKALETKLKETAFREEDCAFCLAVELPAAGKVIGEIMIFGRSAEHRLAEIGYVFHPDFGGQGYATEAATEVLRLAFEDFGRHRVIGRIDARNTPSARVLERLGMRREAYFVANELWKGEWTDEVVYAMLDHEWRARTR